MRTSLRRSAEPAAPAPASSCTTCSSATPLAKVGDHPWLDAAENKVRDWFGLARTDSWVYQHEAELKAALAEQKRLLTAKKAELARNDAKTKANLKKFFGSDSEATRQTVMKRVDNELKLNEQIAQSPLAHFRDAEPAQAKPNNYAYVYPTDTRHKIYLDAQFRKAAVAGEDSRAGTLAHEMSHFDDIAGTRDKIYGADNALALAQVKPDDALKNADSFEYYVEGNR